MINRDRMFTERYASLEEVRIDCNSAYLYHKGLEERSTPAGDTCWEKSTGARFVDVDVVDVDNDIAEDSITHKRFSLRSENQVMQMLAGGEPSSVYVDSSGLSVRALAPLLKCATKMARSKKTRVYVVYVEPCLYDVKRFKEGGRFYNLAEGFNGLSPLPGFGSIMPTRGKSALVPMLGFEGGRFAHIINQLSPEDDVIIPVVGVAGYRPEYPFVTYVGNKRTLEETESWANVKYAMAGSVVDAFFELVQIMKEHQDVRHWKIAPIGTKPHTIAALLLAILNPIGTEIVYDNPNRKKPRTTGVGCVSVTCISDLIADYSNA